MYTATSKKAKERTERLASMTEYPVTQKSVNAARPNDGKPFVKISRRGVASLREDKALNIEQRFSRLVAEWKRESSYMSDIERMALLPSYQAIIGIGPDAVPLLLKELQNEPDHWVWALHAITQEDPADGQGSMRFADLVAVWLEWGRQQGLV